MTKIRYTIYDQNGWKTTLFGAAHTYVALIRSTPPPIPRGEKPARQKKITQSIKTKSKRFRDWHEYWLSDHTYTISSLWYSATWNIPTLMNIMLVLLSKSRIGFLMFQRVKSSQLEEVEKSLTKLETSNDNLKKMVRRLAKNKKNMNEKNIIITIWYPKQKMQSGFDFTFCNWLWASISCEVSRENTC